jgi:hypothetical protein
VDKDPIIGMVAVSPLEEPSFSCQLDSAASFLGFERRSEKFPVVIAEV